MGYGPDTVGWMTMREVGNAVSGFFKFKESEHKTIWEAARLAGWCSISPHVKKGKSFKLQDVTKFSWERTVKDPVKVRKDAKELAAKWRKSIPKNE